MQETYPLPGLRDDSLDEFVVITFLIDSFIDNRFVLRLLILLNTLWGSRTRINTSPNHFSTEGLPNARGIPSHAVPRLFQSIRGVTPHLVHLELQTINRLFQQYVLRLLVIEGAIRLLSQFKISGKLVDAVFENLLLLAPFVCFDGMESGCTGILFDFRVPAAEAESVSF